MSKLFMFEKPLGMRDTLPELYQLKRHVKDAISKEMRLWGYVPIETPTLEFYETVGSASAILDQQLFKLLDQQGNTLVLRPDMTAPIARIAASTLKSANRPLRLTYDAPVFRAQQIEGGRPAEFEQVGVELIGDQSNSADAEVISLMMASLHCAGTSQSKVAIGHIGFVNAFLMEVLGNETRVNHFRRFLYEKNYVGFRKEVEQLPLSSIDKQRLFKLLRLKGDPDIILEAEKLAESEEALNALKQLNHLFSILHTYELETTLIVDLNLVMHMSYYTGTVFEAYSERLGYPVGSGGRYDQLLDEFDHSEPATGFGLRLDRLTEAIGQRKVSFNQDVCLIFSHDRRKEAMVKTKELRQQGRSVVMQELSGINDVDAYSAQFEDVIYFVGSNGKGEGTQ
ncbi:ATP phosphoribosyltransferase regulatory subunit [Salipaludibacillus sp. LMS25]|jgi:ATP phosphoribosyltransferase regulatory subunit|uniref:ATP phosphoribosyltransferase regulatory subunit n=1 Tax=Salipaludibacillus sp. LMS25 TaxID=2924031 RepID=UPI0020D1812A|nr:ATP phosphoribosyltransferase regulatory subunit [Salipaludibacillus sp. LMS25]UTR15987.1 ATP phosphoribosyltransferase regulatory subunit [Salipaludibacillus sp. LMS25]